MNSICPHALSPLLSNFQSPISISHPPSSPNLSPTCLYFSNLSQSSIFSASLVSFLCFLPKTTCALFRNEWPSCAQHKPGFFLLLYSFLLIDSLLPPLFLKKSPIKEYTMQRVYFPFQLSGTSYKLKSSLPYQVSLSILGNMHNIGNTVLKKKKREKKENRKKREKPEEKEKDANT